MLTFTSTPASSSFCLLYYYISFNLDLKSELLFCLRLLGVDKVIQYAVNEWLTDIRKNQLPGILGGVGPMHSVVQLCEYEMSYFCSVLSQLLSNAEI